MISKEFNSFMAGCRFEKGVCTLIKSENVLAIYRFVYHLETLRRKIAFVMELN